MTSMASMAASNPRFAMNRLGGQLVPGGDSGVLVGAKIDLLAGMPDVPEITGGTEERFAEAGHANLQLIAGSRKVA